MAATDSDAADQGATASDSSTAPVTTSSSGSASTPAPGTAGAAQTTTETTAVTLDPAPNSWSAPGEQDIFSLYGAIMLMFVLFIVIYLYAVFDRFAGRQGSGTPLRTTIPTMLTVGMAYDLLPPLEAVNILLPAALIIAALARDIALWIQPDDPAEREAEAEAAEARMEARADARAEPQASPSAGPAASREETAG